MTVTAELRDVRVRFGDVTALDSVTTTFAAGAVTGLLGRNGAGKSTLLAALAGYRRPTEGTVLVAGGDPHDDPRAASATCLVRAVSDLDQTMPVDEVFQVSRYLRRSWDQATAERLADRFELPRQAKVATLSTGQASALLVTTAIAARAPLTMFDEPQLGMDPPTRYAFYDELLADYAAHPRTIIVATHLIDEVVSLFEHVAIVDEGRLVLHEPLDSVLGRGAELTGPADAVDRVAGPRRIVQERRLGPTRSVVVVDGIDDDLRRAAAAADVQVGPLSLQDLFVHLTSQELKR